jgi:hypothetical protein
MPSTLFDTIVAWSASSLASPINEIRFAKVSCKEDAKAMTGTFAESLNLLLRAGCGFENLQPVNRSGHVLTGVEDMPIARTFPSPALRRNP